MAIEGVDYAWDRPEPTGLAAVGKRFACRYVGPGSVGKLLDPAEARALSAAGLSIVANAEGAHDGLLGGRAAGMSWARLGHDGAVRCGMPPDKPIYLSVDFDIQAGQWAAVREALRGAADVLGPARVGVYGGYDAIAWAHRDGAARWFWQTYAWSGGRWHPAAHVHQYRNGVSLVGGTVDLDRTSVSNYGQWTPVGVPASDGEDDMALSAEDKAWIIDAIHSLKLGSSGPTLGIALQRTYAATYGANLAAASGRIESKVDALALDDTSSLALAIAALAAKLDELAATPLVDPVAVAAAIATHPEISAALAAQVAGRLSHIEGELTLTGSANLGIRPDAE